MWEHLAELSKRFQVEEDFMMGDGSGALIISISPIIFVFLYWGIVLVCKTE